MTGRERMTIALRNGIPDRVPKYELPWKETLLRWYEEGLPRDVHPNDYFDFDLDECFMVDQSLKLPEKTLEDTDDWLIRINQNGVVEKWLKEKETGLPWFQSTKTPHCLEYTLKTAKDWAAHKERIKAAPDRVAVVRWGDYLDGLDFDEPWPAKREKIRTARARNKFNLLLLWEPYDLNWRWWGQEEFLIKMKTEPDLIRDIFEVTTRFVLELTELLLGEKVEFDGVFFGGDIAYKNGMFFSPPMYRELLMPYHQRIFSFFRQRDIPILYDTDGNVDQALPLLIEAGIDALRPLEAKCGNDVRVLKGKYGDRVALVGNMNVVELQKGKEAIYREVVSKLQVAKRGGGYVFCSDHTLPPMSLENYRYALELVAEYGKY